MFSSVLTLDHFIQAVPCCELTTDFSTVLTILQSEIQNKVVVVDEHRKPLGIVSCVHFGQFLLQRLQVKSVLDQTVLEEFWQELESFLTPLPCLSVSTNMTQLGTILKANNLDVPYSSGYGIIDHQGKFLGLLNQEKLLRYLFLQQSESNPRVKEFFLNFLEQLPFPVNLVTEQGESFYQNRHWQTKIGMPINFFFKKNLSSQELFSTAYASDSWEQISYPQCEVTNHNSLAVEILTRSLSPLNTAPIYSPGLPDSRQEYEREKVLLNRPWELLKIPLDFSGIQFSCQPLCLIIALDRLEEQNLVQELALKNADLVQLDRLKDEFLTCISHELKSPLTSVIGLSSLLKEQKIGSLSERQVHYAELIYQGGRHLMTLVNDLLDLTRLETGELKLSLTSVDINSICQQAHQALLDKYQHQPQQEISFSLEIQPGFKTIKADQLRLQQILVHLLDNALKLSELNGTIGIQVKQWDHWLAFTVWDRGKSIPEEEQSLVFEQCQQWEHPWTGQLESGGLGLVLSQRLAKAHGGDISFISRQDQGNQFTLLLPLTSLNHGCQINNFSALSRPLILIVESMPKAIENLNDQLNCLGYPVVIARTGTEALEKARQLKPDKIFLNPLLPLLSGWDVLKLLKSDPRTKDIQIIITSSLADQQYSQQNGGDYFLSLPIDNQALKNILQSELIDDVKKSPLTILRIHPICEDPKQLTFVDNSPLEKLLKTKLSQLNYRLLEADNLDQAEMIAMVWDVDVVVLDNYGLPQGLDYIEAFCTYENLLKLPLVTLDSETTAFANQTGKLSVFPCLISPHEPHIESLLEVIAIAAHNN